MSRSLVHYGMHFLVIGVIAYLYDKKNWKKGWFILAATMVVDADHLLADPIFSPNRCSIGFHPLHSYYAIGVYILGLLFVKQKMIKLVFVGLLFHMLTDAIDCWWMKML